MAIYDSEKTRQAAKLTTRVADGVSTEVIPGVRAAQEELECFHGRTAQTMEEKLARILRMAADTEEEFRVLSHHINVYADMLEQADQQLAEKL